jgi:FdhE protein
MQRILDPEQIGAFAQRAVPRVRLPDPTQVFSLRASRLRKLSEGHAVGDYLRLMAAVADAQQEVLNSKVGEYGVHNEQRMHLAREHGMPPLQATEWPRDERWHEVLHNLCSAIAATPGYPAGVARVCSSLQDWPAQKLEEQADLLLGVASERQVDASAAPFIMASLQVYWTRMVTSLTLDAVSTHVAAVDVAGICPACWTLPVASIVRAEKAHQGYRYLHCALCATEWHLVRIKCSHCESTEGIHYHSIQGGSQALRAEACDTCKTYRKICYQEHDMDIEPLADDLASLALDLLMTEEGFHRASGNPLLWQES